MAALCKRDRDIPSVTDEEIPLVFRKPNWQLQACLLSLLINPLLYRVYQILATVGYILCLNQTSFQRSSYAACVCPSVDLSWTGVFPCQFGWKGSMLAVTVLAALLITCYFTVTTLLTKWKRRKVFIRICIPRVLGCCHEQSSYQENVIYITRVVLVPALNLCLLLLAFHLLVQCGDVESNPGPTSIEYDTMVSCADKIVEGISRDPKGLAIVLFGKGLISQDLFERTIKLSGTETDGDKARVLYLALLKVVEQYPEKYKDFTSSFDSEPTLYSDLLEELASVYQQHRGFTSFSGSQASTVGDSENTHLSTHHSGSQTTSDISSPPSSPLSLSSVSSPSSSLSMTGSIKSKQVDRILQKNLTVIKRRFFELVHKIKTHLKDNTGDIETFRVFLQQVYGDELLHLDFEDIDSVFNYFINGGNWDFMHFDILSEAIELFKDASLKQAEKEYQHSLSGFYATTKISDFIEEFERRDRLTRPRSRTGSDPYSKQKLSNAHTRSSKGYRDKLSLKLDINVEKHTMQYIESLWKELSQMGVPKIGVVLDCIIDGGPISFPLEMSRTGSLNAGNQTDHDTVKSKSVEFTSKEQSTPLSEEDKEALHKVLQEHKVEVPLGGNQLPFEKFQLLLQEKGHEELAINLRAKLDEVIQHQKHYLQQLDKLMTDQDTFDLCCLRLLLVGPPFVGKTTTLKRLLKVFENISNGGDKAKQKSTLLANCTQVLAFVHKDAAEWLASQDVDEEAKLLFGYLCGDEIKDLENIHVHGPNERLITRSKLKERKPQVTDSAKTLEVSGLSKHPAAEENTTARKLHSIKSKLQKVIKSGDYTKIVSFLGSTLLNITDVGGQPGFLEMLPALMKGPAMYLVFLDLSKELDQLYKIPFSRDDTDITPYDSEHTVKSTVSQVLSSISSMHAVSTPNSFATKKAVGFHQSFKKAQQIPPLAALIGTHLDKLQDPKEEKVVQTDQALEKTTQKFHEILVSSDSQKGNSRAFVFAVDNLSGTEQSDIAPLRKLVTNTIRTHFRDATLPIRKNWLMFGIILRREYFIATMKECYQIGEMLDMSNEEVDVCLWYLSEFLGTIMLFTNIPDDDDGWFKGHVICSPQVIFDSISQLILASLRTLHSNDPVRECDRKEWMEKGQFSAELIERYCVSDVNESKVIPTKHLIKLLKHVNLLSPIVHSKGGNEVQVTYLFPALLECTPPHELSKPPTPDVSNPEPIHITFECGFVPTGAFCGLVTQLVSEGPKKILGLTWTLMEDTVKRNFISFNVANSNKVTLLAHERSYEIRVVHSLPQMSLHSLCSYVLSVMLYMLKKLNEQLVPQIAFPCACPNHQYKRDNLCILKEDCWIQFLCGSKQVTLTKHQQIWFGNPVTPGSSVDLEVLEYSEEEFSFKWKKSGSRRQLPTPREPNILTLQSVCEKDFGYYQCEVKEAGKEVLTVFKALYKDDLKACSPFKKMATEAITEQSSTSGPLTQYCTRRLQLDERAPSVPREEPPQDYDVTVTRPAGNKLGDLLKKLKLTEDSLNCEIKLDHVPIIARYFDSVDLYIPALGLCQADGADVKRTAFVSGTQVGITECLKLWSRHDPSAATYRALVNTLLMLGKEEVALNVCRFLCQLVTSSEATDKDIKQQARIIDAKRKTSPKSKIHQSNPDIIGHPAGVTLRHVSTATEICKKLKQNHQSAENPTPTGEKRKRLEADTEQEDEVDTKRP